MSGKVHRVQGQIVRSYRLLPYSEIIEILREDGTAFFEDTPKKPLNRGTIWRAARKLSDLLGEKVVYQRVLMTLPSGVQLEGYLFAVASRQSENQKKTL